MKVKFIHLSGLASLVLFLPAAGETIYSGLIDTPIPTDFDGVTLTIGSGSFNPFFGGVGFANNVDFQPGRLVATNIGTLQNFAVGATIDANLVLGNNFGGSQDHVGTTFTAGTEGYIGFKNGSNYGWMRVIFTNNTGGALIKDWAYDNGVDAAINVGRVAMSAAVANAQTLTFSPGGSEAFTYGSAIADNGLDITSVAKTGAGTTTLNGSYSYTGTTTVSDGRLNVNGTTNAASTFTVAAGKTLGGDGTINGNVTLNGILRPGQGGSTDRTLNLGGTLTANTGSSMEFTIAAENNHDQLIVGSVDLANTDLSIGSFTDSSVTELVAGDGLNFLTNGSSFYKLINGTTTNMFANATGLSAGELTYFGLSGPQFRYSEGGQTFWVAQPIGGSTYLVAIPEPSIGLLGSLSLLGLALRRRR